MTMTVEQAVLDVIIGYVEQARRHVPISAIEQAHPEHQLSGRARLRGLRHKGLLNYAYDEKRKAYLIFTPLADLYRAQRMLQSGNRMPIRAAEQQSSRAVEQQKTDTGTVEEEPMTAAEIRKLIESLG